MNSLPTLTPVKSSNIDAVAHKDDKLFVKFKGGNAIYEYAGVPASVHDDMLKSESIGRHFALNVKGRYSHRVHTV